MSLCAIINNKTFTPSPGLVSLGIGYWDAEEQNSIIYYLRKNKFFFLSYFILTRLGFLILLNTDIFRVQGMLTPPPQPPSLCSQICKQTNFGPPPPLKIKTLCGFSSYDFLGVSFTVVFIKNRGWFNFNVV